MELTSKHISQWECCCLPCWEEGDNYSYIGKGERRAGSDRWEEWEPWAGWQEECSSGKRSLLFEKENSLVEGKEKALCNPAF